LKEEHKKKRITKRKDPKTIEKTEKTEKIRAYGSIGT
jgi:hypothetical protein